MGIHAHTYLGPFIKIKNEQETVTVNISSCSNHQCKNYKKKMSSGFCNLCGRPIGPVPKQKTQDKINLSEVLVTNLNEALAQIFTPSELVFDGFIYLIPNLNRNAPRAFILGDYEFSVNTNLNRDLEIAWFKQAFQGEIQTLQSLYTPGGVEILWGLITYYN
jgi:hypothetical protein